MKAIGMFGVTAALLTALSFTALSRAEDAPSTSSEPKLPKLAPLFDYPVRDTCVCLGPDDTYYLTGTTGHPTWWQTNDGGIRLWKSKDLKKWEPLGPVWTFEKNATWQKKEEKDEKGNPLRALWAPEVHYFKNTFWITYCINYSHGGTGVLKSTSGKVEGPYVDIKPDGPLTDRIDASLYCDDDGKAYFVWQNGMIARLKDDMSGLAEEPRHLKPANAEQVGFEGAFLTKINGRYRLVCAEFNQHENGPATYDCMIAESDKLYGPYGDRYLAIPHGGHNMLFKDKDGGLWSTFFGSDPKAPFTERPAILPLEFDANGRIRPKM
jgi:beta-xylosidase